MKIYCDSSTREACVVIEGQDPMVLPYSEPVTVNVGEYKAVIWALTIARTRNYESVEILTDSLLVVKQVRGEWKCRKAYLLPLRDRVRGLMDRLTLYQRWVHLRWLPREENLAGRVLEGK